MNAPRWLSTTALAAALVVTGVATGCDSSEPDAESKPEAGSLGPLTEPAPPAVPPEREPVMDPPGTVVDRDLKKNPDAYKLDSVWGFVLDEDENPIEDATLTFEGDKTHYPINPKTGSYAHYPDRSVVGDPPYVMVYAAEGFETQRIDVPELPHEGVELDVTMRRAATP